MDYCLLYKEEWRQLCHKYFTLYQTLSREIVKSQIIKSPKQIQTIILFTLMQSI